MNYENHPCFSSGAKHKFGRIHLPVAPKCNMQCNYCDRDFQCVNESRPGVTTAVLTPLQSANYLDAVLNKIQNISVVGIAGPGDPFANASETMETLHIIRKRHPEITLCLATNGLELSKYVDDIAKVNVSHLTVTVNAVNPEVGGSIYAWARFNGRVYRGIDAAALILEKQLKGINMVKEAGITVKINTVVIPGINDNHVTDIARLMADMNVDIMNCIPLFHVAGTAFAHIHPPTAEKIGVLRKEVIRYLPQMEHCGRCRADAVGLIGETQQTEIIELLRNATRNPVTAERPFVAVASMEGIFVNQHLGEAGQLWIFGMDRGQIKLMENRPTPVAGNGDGRWAQIVTLLRDCNNLLVSGIGPNPQKIIERAGIGVTVMEGLAREGLEAIYSNRDIPRMLLKTPGRCGIGKGCTGTGMGCG